MIMGRDIRVYNASNKRWMNIGNNGGSPIAWLWYDGGTHYNALDPEQLQQGDDRSVKKQRLFAEFKQNVRGEIRKASSPAGSPRTSRSSKRPRTRGGDTDYTGSTQQQPPSMGSISGGSTVRQDSQATVPDPGIDPFSQTRGSTATIASPPMVPDAPKTIADKALQQAAKRRLGQPRIAARLENREYRVTLKELIASTRGAEKAEYERLLNTEDPPNPVSMKQLRTLELTPDKFDDMDHNLDDTYLDYTMEYTAGIWDNTLDAPTVANDLISDESSYRVIANYLGRNPGHAEVERLVEEWRRFRNQ
jgi:hypothetical protein